MKIIHTASTGSLGSRKMQLQASVMQGNCITVFLFSCKNSWLISILNIIQTFFLGGLFSLWSFYCFLIKISKHNILFYYVICEHAALATWSLYSDTAVKLSITVIIKKWKLIWRNLQAFFFFFLIRNLSALVLYIVSGPKGHTERERERECINSA